MINANLDLDDLLTLVKGLVPPYGGDKYSEFCGDQWNEDWKWKEDAFNKMDEDELWAFYLSRKGK